ncbi:MAG TPA: hypothetical protein VGD58_00355 [Herpetosiphonaceae bacterium]
MPPWRHRPQQDEPGKSAGIWTEQQYSLACGGAWAESGCRRALSMARLQDDDGCQMGSCSVHGMHTGAADPGTGDRRMSYSEVLRYL